jgi:Protein of unknown function (DUF1761)
MQTKLNYPAIIVAGIVYWLVQAVWYTVLSAQWIVASGVNPADSPKGAAMALPFAGSFICDIIVAWALAWVLTRTGRTTALAGAVSGAALSIGFLATGLLTNYLFEGRPRALFYINAGCALVGMAVAGAIVGAWQKSGARSSATAA